MMSEQLPEWVFCQQADNGDEFYLRVAENAHDFAEPGEVITAGRYELVETVEIKVEEPVITVTPKGG